MSCRLPSRALGVWAEAHEDRSIFDSLATVRQVAVLAQAMQLYTSLPRRAAVSDLLLCQVEVCSVGLHDVAKTLPMLVPQCNN